MKTQRRNNSSRNRTIVVVKTGTNGKNRDDNYKLWFIYIMNYHASQNNSEF